LDDKLLVETADGIEVLNELGEEDKDFLNWLEKMVEEVRDEPGSID